MTRRTFAASAVAASLAQSTPRTSMGVATTCYLTAWRPKDTLEFMDHCHGLGAGGVQASLASLDTAYLAKVRAKAEQYGMYIEVMCPMPRQDATQFEAILKGAKAVGALCVRSACLGGRRYETFSTLAAWKQFVADSRAAIRRAVPIAEKLGVKFTLENHKDWTAEEFVKLLKEYSSPNLGVCLDTGNNISLIDDPMELVEALAPYAISTHLKDMAVAPYNDGFLLSEVPFGDGFLDMKRIIAIIKDRQPATKFTLEMITRNPLRVPVLTDKYWETFPERSGRYLARALRMVQSNKPRKPLPTMEGRDAAAQIAYENDNVKLCLAYAREHYGLA